MQILWIFCHLITLIIVRNSVKSVRVTKNVKEITFEVASGDLDSKKSLHRQSGKFSFSFYGFILTVKFVKNTHIYASIFIIFLKNVLK